MKVTFYNDFSVIIDEKINLKLGDMLIEFISTDFSNFYSLCDNLIDGLKKIDATNHLDTPLDKYLNMVEAINKFEHSFYEQLSALPFYKIAKPSKIEVTNEIIRTIKACFNYCEPDTLLGDASFEFNDDWYNTGIQIVSSHRHSIYECSELFKETVHFCLFGDDIVPIEKLNEYGLEKILKRINKIGNDSYNNFSLEHKIQMVNSKPSLIEVLSLSNPAQFLYQDFINLVKNGLRIKTCLNCGKYFVLFSGHSIEYCTKVPEGETKPCNVIGSARQYTKKVKDDPVLEHYTRSYKTHFSRKRAGYLTEEQFKEWSKEAKLMRKRAYDKEITLEEFIAWCKQ